MAEELCAWADFLLPLSSQTKYRQFCIILIRLMYKKKICRLYAVLIIVRILQPALEITTHDDKKLKDGFCFVFLGRGYTTISICSLIIKKKRLVHLHEITKFCVTEIYANKKMMRLWWDEAMMRLWDGKLKVWHQVQIHMVTRLWEPRALTENLQNNHLFKDSIDACFYCVQ